MAEPRKFSKGSGANYRCVEKLASQILPDICHSHSHGLHIWLELPEHVDQYGLIQTAQQQGLGVASSAAFCVEQQMVNALRISLGGAKIKLV
ncbi:hypothetical protein OURE66S_02083 [Oligella ureolytica]